MFSSLMRSRCAKYKPRRTPFRLACEVLEARDCPSGVEVDATRSVLALMTFDARVTSGHEVQLSGHVSGAFNPGAAVNFSGAASGSCILDASGDFSFSTDSASLGTVYAVGLFDQTTFTDVASAEIAVAPSSIQCSISGTTNDSITFSGTLTGLDVAGQLIQVSSSLDSPVYSDSQGNFSFTVSRASLTMIEVSEMDLWGQESNVSHIDAPPYIDSFSVTSMGNGNNWVFQGHVNGTNLDGLIVTLGGITQLENQTVTVGADGSFTITIDMGAPFQGNITAVTSQDGVSSNLVNCIV